MYGSRIVEISDRVAQEGFTADKLKIHLLWAGNPNYNRIALGWLDYFGDTGLADTRLHT